MNSLVRHFLSSSIEKEWLLGSVVHTSPTIVFASCVCARIGAVIGMLSAGSASVSRARGGRFQIRMILRRFGYLQ
jgi:hypothetical protein